LTWMASSRVGARTRAWTARTPGSTAARSGSPKAAVLPVPVCATPTTSRPARSSGIASVWMTVGVVKQSSTTAERRDSGRPRPAKPVSGRAGARSVRTAVNEEEPIGSGVGLRGARWAPHPPRWAPPSATSARGLGGSTHSRRLQCTGTAAAGAGAEGGDVPHRGGRARWSGRSGRVVPRPCAGDDGEQRHRRGEQQAGEVGDRPAGVDEREDEGPGRGEAERRAERVGHLEGGAHLTVLRGRGEA